MERMEKIEGQMKRALHLIALVALTELNIVSTQNRHLLSKCQYVFFWGGKLKHSKENIPETP